MPTITSYRQGAPCYVELYTPDQAAAKEFYGPLFGWDLQDSPIGEDAVYTSVRIGDAHIAGLSAQMPDMAGHPAFWTTYLAVDDVDKSALAVTEAGGTVEMAPMDVMDLGRMAAIQDPAQARVCLWQAKSSIGTTLTGEPGTPCWWELIATDIGKARDFYASALGVTWHSVPMEAGEYTMIMIDGQGVAGSWELDPAMAAEGVPPHWVVYFGVEDVDATVAKATSLGATVSAAAFDVPQVGRMAGIRDPQGGVFWVMTGEEAAA